MGKLGIFQSMKWIIPDLYDDNGNRRLHPIGNVKNKGLSKEAIDMMYSFIELVDNYGIVGETSKLYVHHRDMTMRELARLLNENGVDTNESKVLSKIVYDQRKLESMFGKDILVDAMNDRANVAQHRENIERVKASIIMKVAKDSRLVFRTRDDVVMQSYDGDFISDYYDILSTYSKSRVEKVEATLFNDKKFSGYYNYLRSKQAESDQAVQKDIEKLDDVLNGTSNMKNTGSKVTDDSNMSIEHLIVHNGVSEAIEELCNRVRAIESNSIYNRHDREEYIRTVCMSRQGCTVKRSNGKMAIITDKTIIISYEMDVDNRYSEVKLDKLLNDTNYEEYYDNLRSVIAEAKCRCINDRLDYSKSAIIINGNKYSLLCIEDVLKSVASDNNVTVQVLQRFIRISTDKGCGIVMNSNEDSYLKEI